MAHINLLPWRETLRKERQKEFVSTVAFAAVVSGIIVFYVHIHMNGLIQYQEKRNTYLDNEITLLEKKIAEIKELESTKKALLDRMNIIQELQVLRPGVVHLFDELVTTLPDGAHLASLAQRASQLTITGRAESNARVSAYMRKLDASDWLTNSTLDVIETKQLNNMRISSFQLKVEQTGPKKGQDGKDGANK
jgi:type IV pilus assembly protein PilN